MAKPANNLEGKKGVMEIAQILHMNGGSGEDSYAQNSLIQERILSITKHIREKSILDVYYTTSTELLCIADLGCSSGPNAFLVITDMINAIDEKCRELSRPKPELQIFLNDLPGNDFNAIFRSIPDFYVKLGKGRRDGLGSCFIAGVPGSFYGRLFPSRSLHFVHSASSLHWLSQVPPELHPEATTRLNKGKLYISKTSPPFVFDAYLSQFQRDFSLFLKSRSEEIISGGRVLLTFVGRKTADPSTEEACLQWEIIAEALQEMALEGLVEDEKIDSFNAPYYAPSLEELFCELQKEGSFALDCLETFQVYWDTLDGDGTISKDTGLTIDNCTSGKRVAKMFQAVVESMFTSHFGEEIVDYLFQKVASIVDKRMLRKRPSLIYLVISLTRKD